MTDAITTGTVPGAGYRLAASAEMLFVDLPFADRVQHIHDAGFLVEIWDWTVKDIDVLAASDASIVSMTGYLTGNLTQPDGITELLDTAAQSLEIAERLNCPALNLHGTGLDDKGLPVRPVEVVTGPEWVTAVRTLEKVAALGEKSGREFFL